MQTLPVGTLLRNPCEPSKEGETPMTWDTLHPSLRSILRNLHARHFADMEPHECTAEWITPQIAEHLAAHAQWMTPSNTFGRALPAIRYEPYTPYQCNNAALDRLVLYPGSCAWVGYALDVPPESHLPGPL